MNDKKIKQPLSDMACMHFSHLGKVLSNLSIFFVVISFSSLLTFIIYPVFFMLWLFIAIVTLGMVFIINPEYGAIFTKGTEIFSDIINFLGPILPYSFGLAFVSSVLSIIFLSLDKNEKHWGRIVTSAIFLGITVIGFIVLIAGGLK